MEYAIHLLALFIALNFLLKVGFYPRWGMWTVAAGCAFFAWLVTPWMTEQSKTVVAAFFASRPQMLNLSVCVTLEAAVMITFCFDCFAEMRTRNTAFKQAVTLFLKLYPGILIGGVICYVLALLLFTFPGEYKAKFLFSGRLSFLLKILSMPMPGSMIKLRKPSKVWRVLKFQMP